MHPTKFIFVTSIILFSEMCVFGFQLSSETQKSLMIKPVTIQNGTNRTKIGKSLFLSYDWLFFLKNTDCQGCNENSVKAIQTIVNELSNSSILVVSDYTKNIDFIILKSSFKNKMDVHFFNANEPFIFYNSFPMQSSILISLSKGIPNGESFFLISGDNPNGILKFIKENSYH